MNSTKFFLIFLSLVLAALGGTIYKTSVPKNTIQKLTSVFENSMPELQYDYCENIDDGRGLTFGFPGFCSGTYDGTIFLKEYKRLNPENKLVKYITAFEKVDKLAYDSNGCSDNTEGLSGFAGEFASCVSDPCFKEAQHNIVNKLYWDPSMAAANTIGAKYNITKGELYDAFINHGEDGALELIDDTNKAMGGTPKSGINEKEWLSKFLSIRLAVLKSDPTWQEAVDRVYVYQKLLNDGNIKLNTPMEITCYGDKFTIK